MSTPEIRPKGFPRTLPAGLSLDRTRTNNNPFASQATSRATSSGRSSSQRNSATGFFPTSSFGTGPSPSNSEYRYGRALGAGAHEIVRDAAGRQSISLSSARVLDGTAERTLPQVASRSPHKSVRSRPASGSTPRRPTTQYTERGKSQRGRHVEEAERIAGGHDRVLQHNIRQLIGNPTNETQILDRLPTPKLSPDTRVFANYTDAAGRTLDIPKPLADATQDFLQAESTRTRGLPTKFPPDIPGRDERLEAAAQYMQAAQRSSQSVEYRTTRTGNVPALSRADIARMETVSVGTSRTSGTHVSRADDMQLPDSSWGTIERDRSVSPNTTSPRVKSYDVGSQRHENVDMPERNRNPYQATPGLRKLVPLDDKRNEDRIFDELGEAWKRNEDKFKLLRPHRPKKFPIPFDDPHQEAPEEPRQSRLETARRKENTKHSKIMRGPININSTISKDNTGGDCVRNARLLAEFARKNNRGGIQSLRRGDGELSSSGSGSNVNDSLPDKVTIVERGFEVDPVVKDRGSKPRRPDDVNFDPVQAAYQAGLEDRAREDGVASSYDSSEDEYIRRAPLAREPQVVIERRRGESQRYISIGKEYSAEDVTYSAARHPVTRYIIENGRSIPVRPRPGMWEGTL